MSPSGHPNVSEHWRRSTGQFSKHPSSHGSASRDTRTTSRSNFSSLNQSSDSSGQPHTPRTARKEEARSKCERSRDSAETHHPKPPASYTHSSPRPPSTESSVTTHLAGPSLSAGPLLPQKVQHSAILHPTDPNRTREDPQLPGTTLRAEGPSHSPRRDPLIEHELNNPPVNRTSTTSENSDRQRPPSHTNIIHESLGPELVEHDHTPIKVDPYTFNSGFENLSVHENQFPDLKSQMMLIRAPNLTTHRDYGEMQLRAFDEVLRDIRSYDPNRDMARYWMEHVMRSLEARGADLDDTPYIALQYYRRQIDSGKLPSDTYQWWRTTFSREPHAGRAYALFLKQEDHSANATHVLSSLTKLSIDPRAFRPSEVMSWFHEVGVTAYGLYQYAGARNPRFFGALLTMAMPSLEYKIRSFYNDRDSNKDPQQLCANIESWIYTNPSILKIPEEKRDVTCEVAQCLRRGYKSD